MIHPSWKKYFVFSKKELKGIIVLGLVLFGSILLTLFLPQQKNKSIAVNSTKTDSLFYFDPNTIDSANAILLGIPARQVHTLLKYRSKGGYFKNAADFSKLYGLKPTLIEKIYSFIRIEQGPKNNYRTAQKNYGYFGTTTSSLGNENDWTIELNSATEQDWVRKTPLPIATIKRILAYRNYIGAYTHISQINRVYGFTVEDYQLLRKHLKLKPQEDLRMNANAMRFDDWKSLGILTDQQIWALLKLKKAQGGRLGLRAIVEAGDLSEEEMERISKQVRIVD